MSALSGPNGEKVWVVLGNASPLDAKAKEKAGGKPTETVVKVSPSSSLLEAFKEITDGQGLWVAQSSEDPTFVESNSEALAGLLSEHYGCPVGRKKAK